MVGFKALVVVLVLLLLLAVVISPGGKDKAIGFANDIRTWFGNNMGGLVSTPYNGAKEISVSLEPQLPFTVRPAAPVNITSGNVHINGFSGEIVMEKTGVRLSETSTELKLLLQSNSTSIEGIRINQLSLDGIWFYISPNITATSGNLSISGFHGNCAIEGARLTLEGNVTRASAAIGGISIEV